MVSVGVPVTARVSLPERVMATVAPTVSRPVPPVMPVPDATRALMVGAVVSIMSAPVGLPTVAMLVVERALPATSTMAPKRPLTVRSAVFSPLATT
jgi:hypothetical protein